MKNKTDMARMQGKRINDMLEILKALKVSGPSSFQELVCEFGGRFSRSSIRLHINTLLEHGMIHVDRWLPDYRGAYIVRRFKAGKGQNAVQPLPHSSEKAYALGKLRRQGKYPYKYDRRKTHEQPKNQPDRTADLVEVMRQFCGGDVGS